MQLISRLRAAKSFLEVKELVFQAKARNELKNGVLYEAIKKLNSKECKNIEMGYQLALKIPTQTYPTLDTFTLVCILNSSSQVYDFQLAHKAFSLLTRPNSFNFYYYVNAFKKARPTELTPEMVEGLGSLWRRVELSGEEYGDKLLNQLFSVLSFSNAMQSELMNYIIAKPPLCTFTCGLIGNFLKFCAKINDLDLAKRIWEWGKPIRDREIDTFGYFLIAYQYYAIFPPPLDELMSLWGRVRKSGLEHRVELVSSMCSLLSSHPAEQRNFILHITTKAPNESFDCGLLAALLKHCTETNNINLSNEIWSWSRLILEREYGTLGYFLITFQYYALLPTPVAELKNVWSQVVKRRLDGRVQLVHAMFKALSNDVDEQLNFIAHIISKKPNDSFDCRLLGGFLKCCSDMNDSSLARDIWVWGESIREHETGTFGYFLVFFQYYSICPSIVAELKSLWNQVMRSQLDGEEHLVKSMCSALSADRNEQRNFILRVISRPPESSFTCGILGVFLKHCSEMEDVELARSIWKWSQSLRGRNARGSNVLDNVLVTFQYLNLCESVTEQEAFILEQISHPAPSSYNQGVIGAFLAHCSDQSNLELAARVWSWGLDIRSRLKGTSQLCRITVQYLSICGRSGDLSAVEAVWKEAKEFEVASFIQVIGAFVDELAAIEAVDRVLEVFREVPSEIVDEKLLATTINALSRAGRDIDALNIFRQFQDENPDVISLRQLNSVIDAFSRNGNFEMALSLVEEGKLNGIEADATTWLKVLRPCSTFKNLPVALKAFEEMQKVEHKPGELSEARVLLDEVYQSCGDAQTKVQLTLSDTPLSM